MPSQKRSYSLSPPPPIAKKIRTDFVDLTGDENEVVAQNVPAEHAGESVVLCNEQKDLLELARSRHNIFYTGAAGTGKSVTLKAIVDSLRADGKRVHVVASTGRAALKRIGLTVNTRGISYSEKLARGPQNSQRFQDTDVLIIDEVSMIENNHFERIDRMLKAGRESNLPFGGVQVIVTGDFCQLPPVKPFGNCVHCGFNIRPPRRGDNKQWLCPRGGSGHKQAWKKGDEWAFNSDAWKNAHFVNVFLNTIHRQRDPQFLEMLNRCRAGEGLTGADIAVLSKPGDPDDHAYQSAVALMCKNDEVDRINNIEFNKLDEAVHFEYKCWDNFEWKWGQGLGILDSKTVKILSDDGHTILKELKDHRLATTLELRIGAVVALVTNLDIEAGLCNGSQGRVVAFQPHNPQILPSIKKEAGPMKADIIEDFIVAQLAAYRQLAYPIVEFDAAHGRPSTTRTIYPDCLMTDKRDTQSHLILSRTQIPLIQSWAMTVHRAQGITLTNVRANLSKLWGKGHVYVALSRATSLKGLWLEGTTSKLMSKVEADVDVVKFLQDTRWRFGHP